MTAGRLVVVGVGPGDPELLTLKAARAIEAADVVAYPRTAGGAMAAQIAAQHTGNARHLPFDLSMTGDGAASADYDGAAAAIGAALREGLTVALLCEGDPMLYGSAASVTARLPDAEVTVIPGVTAACAAAASARVPLARGAAPVTILPASAGEAALRRAFRGPGGLVVYKVGRHAQAVRNAAAAADRDATFVANASGADEMVRPLSAQPPGPAPYFSCIVSPARTDGPPRRGWDGRRVAVVTLSASAAATGAHAREALRSAGFAATLHAREAGGDVRYEDVPAHLERLYGEGVAIVAVMAAGIVVRALAPVLGDKGAEPPVLALAEDRSALVPLLGTHRGGARLAAALGEAFGVAPAHTALGEVRHGVALDDPPEGYVCADPAAFKSLSVRLANGEGIAPDPGLPFLDALPRGALPVRAGLAPAADGAPTYIVRRVALGMGASRGADPDAAVAAARNVLRAGGIDPRAAALVASLDVKADEPALHAVADALGVPVRVFDAPTLRREEHRLQRPSDVVRHAVGVAGVAEGAALAAAGPSGRLVIPKEVAGEATFALAEADAPISPAVGRARGHLVVVGLGPGSDAWRSPEATHALALADDLVGYSLYLDMVEGGRAPHQVRHDFPLGAEAERVRFALERAGEGRTVALVSSGDPGVYAMATLVAEMLEGGALSDGAARVRLTVMPGISAAQAAAARAGAPLGHDFAFVSLSDLMTPWPVIVRRLEAAAAGDFAVALYNPRSERRTRQLGEALAILSRQRGGGVPVVIATNVGRRGERLVHTRLRDLDPAQVDMLSVVLVGASQTRAFTRGDGTRVVYTPRGYAVAKEAS